jgi:hypothetical protein
MNEQPNPPIPLTLSLVVCFLFAIAIIVGGYIKGNMHIEAVWKSLHQFT